MHVSATHRLQRVQKVQRPIQVSFMMVHFHENRYRNRGHNDGDTDCHPRVHRVESHDSGPLRLRLWPLYQAFKLVETQTPAWRMQLSHLRIKMNIPFVMQTVLRFERRKHSPRMRRQYCSSSSNG